MKCGACEGTVDYNEEFCPYCGYYKHSLVSPNTYNILRVAGNHERLIESIIDNKEVTLTDYYGEKHTYG